MVRSDSDRIGLGQTLAGMYPTLRLFGLQPFLQAWPLTPAYGAIFGHVSGSLVAFFVSSVYLLAQANIQAILELQKTAKEPEVPKTKVAKGKGKKKVQ